MILRYPKESKSIFTKLYRNHSGFKIMRALVGSWSDQVGSRDRLLQSDHVKTPQHYSDTKLPMSSPINVLKYMRQHKYDEQIEYNDSEDAPKLESGVEFPYNEADEKENVGSGVVGDLSSVSSERTRLDEKSTFTSANSISDDPKLNRSSSKRLPLGLLNGNTISSVSNVLPIASDANRHKELFVFLTQYLLLRPLINGNPNHSSEAYYKLQKAIYGAKKRKEKVLSAINHGVNETARVYPEKGPDSKRTKSGTSTAAIASIARHLNESKSKLLRGKASKSDLLSRMKVHQKDEETQSSKSKNTATLSTFSFITSHLRNESRAKRSNKTEASMQSSLSKTNIQSRSEKEIKTTPTDCQEQEGMTLSDHPSTLLSITRHLARLKSLKHNIPNTKSEAAPQSQIDEDEVSVDTMDDDEFDIFSLLERENIQDLLSYIFTEYDLEDEMYEFQSNLEEELEEWQQNIHEDLGMFQTMMGLLTKFEQSRIDEMIQTFSDTDFEEQCRHLNRAMYDALESMIRDVYGASENVTERQGEILENDSGCGFSLLGEQMQTLLLTGIDTDDFVHTGNSSKQTIPERKLITAAATIETGEVDIIGLWRTGPDLELEEF